MERKIKLRNSGTLYEVTLQTDFDIKIYGRIYNCLVFPDDNISLIFDPQDRSTEVSRKYRAHARSGNSPGLTILSRLLSFLDAQEGKGIPHQSNIIGILKANRRNGTGFISGGYSEARNTSDHGPFPASGADGRKFPILEEVGRTIASRKGSASPPLPSALPARTFPRTNCLIWRNSSWRWPGTAAGISAQFWWKGMSDYFGARTLRSRRARRCTCASKRRRLRK